MAANTSPEEPNRPVEIVPLPAARKVSAPGAGRRGAWRTPAVASSRHEPVSGPSRPDLTTRVHVISPSPAPDDDPTRAHDGARARLLALLDRERASLLSERDAGAAAAHRVSDTAPFPLPTTAVPPAPPGVPTAAATTVAGTAGAAAATGTESRTRRTPKARRPDAPARPLPADIAAAIARATGREQPPPPAPRLSLVRRISARDRLEIVPLDDPRPPTDADTTPSTREHKRSVIDLRERRRNRMLRRPSYLCPKCEQRGVVDLIDDVTGTVRATCPRCAETWTTDLHADQQPIHKRKG